MEKSASDSKVEENLVPEEENQKPQTKADADAEPEPKQLPDHENKSKENEAKANAKPTKKREKPPPSQRALINCRKFLVALRPLIFYVTLLGSSPLKEIRRRDGTGRFLFIPFSIRTLIFFVVAILNTITFILLSIGLISLFLKPDTTNLDRCGYSWEVTMLSRHIVIVTLTWSWITMSAMSGWFVLINGKSYGNFFNYWMKAIQRLDMDVTENTCPQRYAASFDTLFVAVFLVGEFFYPKTQSVNDANAFLIQTMVRLFDFKIYEETVGKTQEYCGEFKSNYFVYSFVGLVIQIYTLFAARCFINQFQFFAKLLGNVAGIWNNRLEATLAHLSEDENDPFLRRLAMNRILGDHLTVVQLFKLTENAYRQVLQTFFGLITFSFCVEVYYISRWAAISFCEQRLESYKSDPITCKKQLDFLMALYKDSVQYGECSEHTSTGVEHAAISSILILHTAYVFSTVTLIGSFSYLEAMKGYRIVRRHSYAECLTRKDRNFIHSMHCSFAPTNPLRMAAGGYVVIEKTLFIYVGAAVLNYFIILLQFRPAQGDFTCLETPIPL